MLCSILMCAEIDPTPFCLQKNKKAFLHSLYFTKDKRKRKMTTKWRAGEIYAEYETLVRLVKNACSKDR